jgi:hypothetical protein
MVNVRMMCFAGAALALVAIPAKADVRSYCEAYARDQADTRLSGSAILGDKSKPSPQEWEERKTLALADCLTLYTPAAKAEVKDVAAQPEPEPAKPEIPKAELPEPVTAPKPKPKLELLARASPAQQEKPASARGKLTPGSQAWKEYCSNKYASFNPDTRTYKSYGGKQKPCLVPRG